MPITITCRVEPLKKWPKIDGGLETVALYVCREFKQHVAQPPSGERTSVVISTVTGDYRGGLRLWSSVDDRVYVCPDLESARDGHPMRLARVLKDCGVQSKQAIEVRIDNGKWIIPDLRSVGHFAGTSPVLPSRDQHSRCDSHSARNDPAIAAAINELWASRDQTEWLNALRNYDYVNRKNLERDKWLDSLDREAVKGFDELGWYDFLRNQYFPWKYTEYLPVRLKSLKSYEETNSLRELFSTKDELFAFDRTDIDTGLKIAKRIRGLGWAGASGLLAVLFPRSFGTVDQFMVKALCQIESLPEREQLLVMKPENLKQKDAVLLIDIMRRKASELNALFGTEEWTPRKIDMILWASRN